MASNQRQPQESNHGNGSVAAPMMVTTELPWGATKAVSPSLIDPSLKPGEFVAQTLFVEFVLISERKMQAVLAEDIDKPLTKLLQRGEDPQFDQLLTAIGSVAENCLPSLLKALYSWYDYQNRQLMRLLQIRSQQVKAEQPQLKQSSKLDLRTERDYSLEKRGLAVDFVFCLIMIEILKQLPLHPGHDDIIVHVVQIAFQHFRYNDPNQLGLLTTNAMIIADLFAEVIGTLAQSRFSLVRKKFMCDLMELRAKEQTPLVVQNVVSLLMGMKFFRVKMVPIEEFEISMNFLHELGVYFMEARDRDIKHALAGLFVEILLPVGASVKTEVNVPVLKNFVELLYPHTLEQANRNKHRLAFFPLLTCLLCISQKQFFLTNWHYFLTMCLSNLKHKDAKMSRVALESLYRLLWVYVIRIKCESNTATNSRLQSIVNSLFPKGSRYVMPRDAPLNIFVKIIHFIAQERLDFAFKEVIFDLLCVGRQIRTIYPERMNIGLRAMLVIADSLQQRDGVPPMPRTIGVMPSGNTLRIKRTFLTKPLTGDIARNIGIDLFYAPCRRAFDGILRSLDLQVGRPLMVTSTQSNAKDKEELLGGERKPKLDLFRTCIAAIPRLLPEGMTHQDVIDLLARLTIHMDDELKGLACQTLQNFMSDCFDWREDVIHGFLQFITKEIQDSYPQLLENAVKILIQLLCSWRNSVQGVNLGRRESFASTKQLSESRTGSASTASTVQVPPVLRADSTALVLHCVEGMALVLLCQTRTLKRLAVCILREVKNLLPLVCVNEAYERSVIDVLDSACTYVLEKYLPHVSKAEKTMWTTNNHVDFTWLAEKVSGIDTDHSLVNEEQGNEYMQWDPWACCLSGFLEPCFLLSQCPTAVAYAWPVAHVRITAVFNYVDPNNPQNDTRASLLRSSKSKATAQAFCGETLNYSSYLNLWQKYLVFACAVAPPALSSIPTVTRCASPDTLQNSSDGEMSRSSDLRIPRLANVTANTLFKLAVPLVRSEMTDMRDSVVLGLGSVNPSSLDCLMEELLPYIREAADRRTENLRRRKRRDLLRSELIRLLEVAVFRGTTNFSLIADESGHLKPIYAEFLESARLYLEADTDRDTFLLAQLRLHFAKLVTILIQGISPEKRVNFMKRELRYNLFYLFAAWSGRLGLAMDRRHTKDKENLSSLELYAVSGMCAVLCCGPVFDPHAISDDGYAYGWLECLLSSQIPQIQPLAEETLVLLLDFNSDMTNLLDWVVEKCYNAPSKVADKCFRALATVFCAREYPCDVSSMFNLTLMYSGYPLIEVQRLAVELLQLLDQRFFGDENLQFNPDETLNEANSTIGEKRDSDPLESSFLKSQVYLSQQLATLHPEMTIPMFSEVTQRFQLAKPARRSALLALLLPWLYNIELVDFNMEPTDRNATLSLSAKITESHAIARRSLKGDGWGSPAASEMVLNNLLYLTIKFGNEHSAQLELLWAGLVVYWPQNLRIIIRYLTVMSMLAPGSILTYAKRIIIYLARVASERVVNELMNELQIVDMFRCPLERIDLPPYYRWIRRDPGNESDSETDKSGGCENVHHHQQGTIHTKRHTPSEEIGSSGNNAQDGYDEACSLAPSASMASLVTLKAEVLNAKFATQPPILGASVENAKFVKKQEESIGTMKQIKHREHVQPFQLPMPAYGGYYCPLNEFLPDGQQAITNMHRSNLSMLFLTDLVMSDVEIDWTVHLPMMLHIAVLGLDHGRELVHDHAKQMLISLIVALSTMAGIPSSDVARALISQNLGSQLSLASKCAESSGGSTSQGENRSTVSSFMSLTGSLKTEATALSSTKSNIHLADVLLHKDSFTAKFNSLTELVITMTNFLSTSMGRQLWQFEEITAKQWRTSSSDLLSCFVSHLNRLMCEMVPVARIETRWAQTALHVALSCSNRHYAGRSFQIFRALHAPLTSQMLSDILSRLVETVGEQGDDMQGYVTEIMLTMESSITYIELSEHCQIENLRELPNGAGQNQSPPPANQRHSPTHYRSTSASVAMQQVRHRNTPIVDRKDLRTQSMGENGNGALILNSVANNNLPRSKSALTLKCVTEEEQDDHMVTLTQLLWIALSMLESDLEHEFLLSLRLLDKLLDLAAPERQEIFERFNRMVQQLKWNYFPGIQALVLKGSTFATAFETALYVLSKLTPLLYFDAVDPSRSFGFQMNVLGILPYMILHYEEPTKLCTQAADQIAEYCTVEMDRIKKALQAEHGSGSSNSSTLSEHPLENLATVMRLYSRRSFTRECFQWTKCIVKYLNDVYSEVTGRVLSLMSEILEKGPAITHQPLLQIIYCLFHYVDLNSQSNYNINMECLKAVSRQLHGPCWKEASKILKLAVTRSSSLTFSGSSEDFDVPRGRELPGRTMDFNVDLAHITALSTDTSSMDLFSPRKTDSIRRPTWQSQVKIREHLVNLLNASGLRVGLPKSPSVIFSQSSHDLQAERLSSAHSSSGDLNAAGKDDNVISGGSPDQDGTETDTVFPVFKEFDFLDGEPDSMSESVDSCFNWLSTMTMRPRSHSYAEEDRNNASLGASVGSVPNLQSQGESDSDSSDDEESSSDSRAEEDTTEPISHDIERLFVVGPKSPVTEQRPHTPALSVAISLGSQMDLSVIPQPVMIALECCHHATGQIEELWTIHCSQVAQDLDGSVAANTPLLFNQLYRESSNKLCGLIRDACHFVAMSEPVKDITSTLLKALDVLMRVNDCPFAFWTGQFLLNVGLLQKLKFFILELREHFETFAERKEHTIKALNAVKSAKKLRMLGQQMDDALNYDQELELCKSLYKLFFQLMLLYESYSKVLGSLETAAVHKENVRNLSQEVTRLQNSLLCSISDLASSGDSPSPVSGTAAQNPYHTLTQLLQAGDVKQAIMYLRAYRSPNNRHEFGCCEEEDLEVLQLLYCRMMAENYTCTFAVVHSDPAMGENCNSLMEMNLQLSAAVRSSTSLRDSGRHGSNSRILD